MPFYADPHKNFATKKIQGKALILIVD